MGTIDVRIQAPPSVDRNAEAGGQGTRLSLSLSCYCDTVSRGQEGAHYKMKVPSPEAMPFRAWSFT